MRGHLRLGNAVVRGQRIAAAASAAAGFAFVKVDYPPRSTANMLRLSRDLKRQGVTQLLCPDAFGPLVGSLRVAVMIHDLIPLTCAAQLRRSLKSRVPGLWRTWLKWQTRRAVGIVTVSEHSASDIANHLGVARDRIAVTPNALTPETLAACGQADPAPREDELLYVGRRDPYKGLATLARVLGRVRELTGRDVKLRIVGPEDLRYPQAQEEIDRLEKEDGKVQEPEESARPSADTVMTEEQIREEAQEQAEEDEQKANEEWYP